jgi:hypothetical protein
MQNINYVTGYEPFETWKRVKQLEILTHIPEGCTAEIVFPSGKVKTLGQGNHQIREK